VGGFLLQPSLAKKGEQADNHSAAAMAIAQLAFFAVAGNMRM